MGYSRVGVGINVYGTYTHFGSNLGTNLRTHLLAKKKKSVMSKGFGVKRPPKRPPVPGEEEEEEEEEE
eukprot:CAMPEP_0182470442 /NCGR_PEP_ID=MMETSP1319-20130603/18702_1 /TAXON_ID=172717 /ORGANISM="Bolidomonas pacifica, Strain RCC208" /LENGTH=67 /DNA_ID=CAMNT_0024670885 /DNA_START=65 /DNA_END=265 /DNA_ORIENTATION=+